MAVDEGVNFKKLLNVLDVEFKACIAVGTLDIKDYFPNLSDNAAKYFTKIITKEYLESSRAGKNTLKINSISTIKEEVSSKPTIITRIKSYFKTN